MQEPTVSTSTSSGGRFLTGLVWGAAIGAAAALLLAPKSGVEMRRQVADSASRLRRQATDAYDTASKAMTDAMDRTRRAYVAGRDALVSAKPNGQADRITSLT